MKFVRAAVGAALIGAALVAPQLPRSATGQVTGPNIVLIITDDMREDQLARMPTVQGELVTNGVLFDKAFSSMPLCCPARASILRGQFAHTHGIYDNSSPGGFQGFRDGGLEDETIATWLDDAGYHTGLVGKYFNGYNPAHQPTYVPRGWDRWRGGSAKSVGFWHQNPDPYETTMVTELGDEFIRSAPDTDPLFLYLSYHAPHQGQTADAQYVGDPACEDVTTSTIPSFNETDIADKPLPIRSAPPMTQAEIDYYGTELPVTMCETLLSVDDGVATILDALEDEGRLANTLVVFTSDHGLALGEHRLKALKKQPYEEVTRVPLVMRYDPLTTGAVDRHLVAGVDLAPTFTDLASISPDPTPGCPDPIYGGGTTCHAAFDGRTLMPILDGTASSWREYLLIETKRACGVRGVNWQYTYWNPAGDPDEEELYKLTGDPYQLTNLMDGSLTPQEQIKRDSMYAKAVEKCDPLPPDMDTI